jgi:hypothetical protein
VHDTIKRKERQTEGRRKGPAELLAHAAKTLHAKPSKKRKKQETTATGGTEGEKTPNKKQQTTVKQEEKLTPLRKQNKERKQRKSRDEACLEAKEKTTESIREMYKGKILQTKNNERWMDWAIRIEGENIRKNEQQDSEDKMYRIEWKIKRDKTQQRTVLKKQIQQMIRTHYEYATKIKQEAEQQKTPTSITTKKKKSKGTGRKGKKHKTEAATEPPRAEAGPEQQVQKKETQTQEQERAPEGTNGKEHKDEQGKTTMTSTSVYKTWRSGKHSTRNRENK